MQCRRRLPVAITNKNIIYLSVPEQGEQRFPELGFVLQLLPTLFPVLLYGQATQLHCQVHVSEFFYPVSEYNGVKKATLESSA